MYRRTIVLAASRTDDLRGPLASAVARELAGGGYEIESAVDLANLSGRVIDGVIALDPESALAAYSVVLHLNPMASLILIIGETQSINDATRRAARFADRLIVAESAAEEVRDFPLRPPIDSFPTAASGWRSALDLAFGHRERVYG